MNPAGQDKDAPIKILFGNKNDLNHLSQVDKDLPENFGKQYKMESYKGSAKTGDQVN